LVNVAVLTADINAISKLLQQAGRFKITASQAIIFLDWTGLYGHGGHFGLSNLRRERGVQRYETMDRHTS